MKIKFLIVLLMCIMSANLSFAFSEKDKQCEDYMLKGMDALNAENFPLALEYVLKAENCDIDEFTYKGILAQCYNLNKNHKKAHKLAKDVIDLKPKRFDGYKIMGDTYILEGNYAAAIEFYKRAIACKNCPPAVKNKLEVRIKDVIKKQNTENPGKEPNLNYTINLDKKVWEIAYFNADEHETLTEYGLIGENVLEYEWTKLITVNYYDKALVKSNFDDLAKQVLNVRINHNEELKFPYTYKVLSKDGNDITYLFIHYGKNERELIRLFEVEDGFYCVRYNVKDDLLIGKERADAIKIIKSVQPKKSKSAFESAFTPIGWAVGGVLTPAILAVDFVDTVGAKTLDWTFDKVIDPIGDGFAWTGKHIFAPIGRGTWWGVKTGFNYFYKSLCIGADGVALGLRYTLEPSAKAIWKYGIKPIGYYSWEFTVLPMGKVTWTILTKTDDYVIDPVLKGIAWTLDKSIETVDCGFEYVLIPIGEGTTWGVKTVGKYTFVPVAKATVQGLEYVLVPVGKGLKWTTGTIGTGIAKGAEYTVVPVVDGVVWTVDNMVAPVVQGVESGVNTTVSAIGDAIHFFAWK